MQDLINRLQAADDLTQQLMVRPDLVSVSISISNFFFMALLLEFVGLAVMSQGLVGRVIV